MRLIADAFPNGVGRGPKADDQCVAAKADEVFRFANQPAASGDDEPIARGKIGDDGAFVGAEGWLALLGKNFGNGTPDPFLDQVVRINERETQLLRDNASDGGLSDPHKTDQRNVFDAANVAHTPILRGISGFGTDNRRLA